MQPVYGSIGPNPLGSILPPSDRERRLGRRSRSFSVQAPARPECNNPADDAPTTLLAPLARARCRAPPRDLDRGLPGDGLTVTVAAAAAAAPPSAPAPSSTPRPPAASVDPVRDLPRDRGRGAGDPRPQGDGAGRSGRPRRRRDQEAHRRELPEGQPRGLVEANERLYKGLGLLPPDASLEDLYVELLGSQVAGSTAPTTRQLYVVSQSGALGPTEKTTFAHEYTHALQDQNFDLESLDISTRSARATAGSPACRSSRATPRSSCRSGRSRT